MTVDKHNDKYGDFSGELKFAALHADDLLLDSIGARRPVGSHRGADGSVDVVAGLLQAYVTELDSRPGPLMSLLTADDLYAAADEYDLDYDVDHDADYDVDATSQPVAAMVPPPPVELASHRRTARAKFLVAHRAAAVVTVGSLVLGIGGVSAAVTGDGGPLDGIRRVVDSVTEQVTPQRSAAERISGLLTDADKALAAKDLREARELLEKARTDIEGASDPRSFSSLRTNLIELRDRWHQAWDDGRTESSPAAKPDQDRFDPVPGESVLSPDGKPGLVGNETDMKPTLPVGPDSKLKQTKDKVADRAEQKLEPLPDLPIDEIRAPTWAPIIGGK
jgi:hypothetical protein